MVNVGDQEKSCANPFACFKCTRMDAKSHWVTKGQSNCILVGERVKNSNQSSLSQKWFANTQTHKSPRDIPYMWGQILLSSSLWKQSSEKRENLRVVLFSSFPTLQFDHTVCLHSLTRIEARLPLGTASPSKALGLQCPKLDR